jgi:glycosyltransferase involved in cell wall biosynthesis
VQNKVLEAMAMDLPVVCSDRVLAGLADGGFRHGRDLLAADTAKSFERCVTELLEDAEARARLAASARQRLALSYRWSTNLDRFEEILAAAARPADRAEGSRPPDPAEDSGERSLGEVGVAEGARSA